MLPSVLSSPRLPTPPNLVRRHGEDSEADKPRNLWVSMRKSWCIRQKKICGQAEVTHPKGLAVRLRWRQGKKRWHLEKWLKSQNYGTKIITWKNGLRAWQKHRTIWWMLAKKLKLPVMGQLHWWLRQGQLHRHTHTLQEEKGASGKHLSACL